MGDKVKARTRRGGISGLKGWANAVLKRADELVPEAPKGVPGAGYLKKSGKVTIDEARGVAAVSFASPPKRSDGRKQPSAGLAVLVHEDMTAQHAPGKQAKYLEQPVNESRSVAPFTMKTSIGREFK